MDAIPRHSVINLELPQVTLSLVSVMPLKSKKMNPLCTPRICIIILSSFSLPLLTRSVEARKHHALGNESLSDFPLGPPCSHGTTVRAKREKLSRQSLAKNKKKKKRKVPRENQLHEV